MSNPPIAASDFEYLRAKLDAKTKVEGDCEVWIGGLHKGYGRLRHRKKWRKVHRLTWELERGPIPEGMGVLHTCDNRRCRKLVHLFLGDSMTNNRDRDAKCRGSAGKRERHWAAVLNEKAVMDILSSKEPAKNLSSKYGVTAETIRRVRRRETWRDPDV